MNTPNDLRRVLDDVPGVTPVAVSVKVAVADEPLELQSGPLRRALGPLAFEGAYCYPIGKPGEAVYPPASERQPEIAWKRVNWLGASYTLSGKTAIHTGDDLDIAGSADIGEPVRAPGAGVVTYAKLVPAPSTWGNVLVIRMDLPDDEWAYVRFAHLNTMLVEPGDEVEAGQIVAYVGNTGMPTAPHFHWDMGKPGNSLLANSPLNWPSTHYTGAEAAAFIRANYVDPGAFMSSLVAPEPEPQPKPEPSGAWYVTTANVNARRAPALEPQYVIAVLAAGTRVRLADTLLQGSELEWRQITDCATREVIGGYIAVHLVKPEPAGDWLQVRAGGAINVRESPAGEIVGSLPGGSSVRVAGEANATLDGKLWTWSRITDVKNEAQRSLVNAWVARELLVVPNPDPPSPPTPVAGASVGLHVAFSGHVGDLLGVARRSAERGVKIPGAVVCSDPGLVAALRPYVDVLVYRWVASAHDPSPFDEDGRGVMSGAAWVDQLMLRHSQAPMADWHQMWNENNFHKNLDFWPLDRRLRYAENVVKFELEALRRADELGVKITAGNYMPGVPEPETFGDVLAPIWDYASAHGHAVCHHWYSDPVNDNSMLNGKQYMIERFLDYWGRWPNMPVLLGETAVYHAPRFRGIAHQRQAWRDVRDVLRPYRQRGRKILAMMWTLRGQQDIMWSGDDFTPHLDEYEQELVAGRLR